MSDFANSVERLLTQIHHWDERRWRVAPAGGGAATRAALVRELVQRLADLGVEAERGLAVEGAAVVGVVAAGPDAGRVVPRMHDLVLRDQVRVLADDILVAEPSDELLERATTAIDEVRAAL